MLHLDYIIFFFFLELLSYKLVQKVKFNLLQLNKKKKSLTVFNPYSQKSPISYRSTKSSSGFHLAFIIHFNVTTTYSSHKLSNSTVVNNHSINAYPSISLNELPCILCKLSNVSTYQKFCE